MVNKKIGFLKFCILFLILIPFLCIPTPILAQTNSNLLDPLLIPKFENQLTGPPPIYIPTPIIENGKIIRNEYTVSMNSFLQQVLPPSMNLLTLVWGYGGLVKDAVTGESLGYVQSTPGSTFEEIKGIPPSWTSPANR